MTWPVAAHLSDSIPADLGDPLLNAWALGWDADRLLHGLRGVWDSPIFYPYRETLAFSEHLLGIAIPVSPVVWITGNPLIAYNLAFVLSFTLAGVGMFVLAREVTGRDEAAWIASLAFAFAPARFGQIGHLQTLMSGWMPLALWALTRFATTMSTASLAAYVGFVLAQALSNNYFIYFLTLPLLVLAVDGVRQRRVGDRRTLLVRLAAASTIVVAVLTPIALVYFDVRRTFGFHRTLQDATTFGADLAAYFHGNEAVHPPIALWRLLPYVAKPGGPEGELFPGVVALALAIVAIAASVRRWRDPGLTRARVYAVILVVALMLSLGGEPTAWGRHLPIGSIFRALFEVVPGFDGIRVPARFSVVVSLALAVLAGFGVVILLKGYSTRIRVTVTTVIGAVMLLEGYGAPLPVAYVASGGRPDRMAYDWIRDHAAGPLVELPTGEFAPALQSFRYEYQTLFHGRRIVNGASGYTPGLHAFVGSFGSPFLEPSQIDEGLRMLRGLGVATVVVHPNDYQNLDVGSWTIATLRASPQVVEQQRFQGFEIFRLAAFGEDERPERRSGRDRSVIEHQTVVRIDPRSFSATSSVLPERLANAFDGDIATRWISSKRQEGDESVELTFDRPYDIARLRFSTSGRSLGDYPRRLVVESVDDSGETTIVYEGPVVFQLGVGLVVEPAGGSSDIWLSRNQTRRLRLRQTGTTRRWAWSIDELSVWRSPE